MVNSNLAVAPRESGAVAQAPSLPQIRSLISPHLDLWLIGGASALLWLGVLAMRLAQQQLPLSQSYLADLTQMFPVLLLFLGYPHLLLSVKLAYGQGMPYVRRNTFNLMTAPAFLILFFVCCRIFWNTPLQGLGWVTSLEASARMIGLDPRFTQYPSLGSLWLGFAQLIMIFAAGWHAARQTFGVMLLESDFTGYRLSASQRNGLQFHLMAVVVLDALKFNEVGEVGVWPGIPLFPLGLSPIVLQIGYAVALGSLAYFYGGTFFKNYRDTGKLPTPGVLVPLVAFYVWTVPAFFLPELTFFFPNLMHSLQYMPFIYKAEKVSRGVATDSPYKGWYGTYLGAVLAGIVFIELIPSSMDKAFPVSAGQHVAFYFVAIYLFLNLHHYFLDSCIWKGKSGSPLKDYLRR